MALPEFNDEGELPQGIHCATLSEVLDRFGSGTTQRCAVAGRLVRAHEILAATGKLARLVVFGSFVTSKSDPNDVDLVAIMEDSFELSQVAEDERLLFQHMPADAHFGVSMFWTRRFSTFGGEQAMLEYWQIRREGGHRGIVEIVEE